ncbi:thioredoxin family protein [Knoellia sp. 3-2P3]|uniref:thioredoxin family protein n=1 Tax=unclassified Knoellia TaxID=2618719 RepID=UPI0023DCAB6E|nr:thioredoxin family protein [Knoellia sp. 3-2P3]MDF2092269.1 thioredoxin family protein [Knoellia sp. 3-2P3]
MIAQVLFIEHCPHHGVAVARLREAARLADLDLVVQDERVSSAADAQRMGFGGSPSIHLDGVDLFPVAQVGDLACRIYPTEAGPQGVPSVEQLVEALRERRDAASH